MVRDEAASLKSKQNVALAATQAPNPRNPFPWSVEVTQTLLYVKSGSPFSLVSSSPVFESRPERAPGARRPAKIPRGAPDKRPKSEKEQQSNVSEARPSVQPDPHQQDSGLHEAKLIRKLQDLYLSCSWLLTWNLSLCELHDLCFKKLH